MPELLLEIRCQEMSPKLVRRLLGRLATRLFEELMSRGIALAELSTGATPRRLALSVRGLPDCEPERENVELGPPASEAWNEGGEPTAALRTFAAERNLETSAFERRSTERGEYSANIKAESGRAIAEVLTPLLGRLMDEAAHGETSLGGGRWPRPVTGFLVLLDGVPLPLELDGHRAGQHTVGHPVLSPAPFEVTEWGGYRQGLAERGVILSLDERRQQLAAKVEKLAAAYGGAPFLADGLLERWSAACEIPGVIDGSLPPEVLSLPAELMAAVLATRQEAMMLSRDGEVLPYFLAVMDRSDDPQGLVRAGRQRAVAGDLLDAQLAFERDSRLPLVQRAKRLEQVIFQARLGTYADKSRRLTELVQLACQELGWDDVLEHAIEAAALAKVDLTTSAVESFPDLHGVLGGVLARSEGYVEPVWRAIYEHRLPIGENGAIPVSRVGRVLAVADRLGTLVGFFGLAEAEGETVAEITQRPSARDPLGLRQLATGLLRLVIEADLDLDLDLLAARAVLLYGDRLEHDAESILRRLQAFLDRRLDHLLGACGYGAEEIEAAKAVGTRSLPNLVARLDGLRAMRGSEELRQLIAVARRMAKMVGDAPESEIDYQLLAEGAESELEKTLREVTIKVDEAASTADYASVIRHLAALVPALERFFAEVLVMDEDDGRRLHRVALLQSCRRLCWRVARLGALEPLPKNGGSAGES